jgi:hypothetical protein
LYPGNHELKLVDEGNFFVVSLLIELTQAGKTAKSEKNSSSAVSENIVV